MRLLRLVVVLFVALLLALAGYAYFGDMGADPRPMRVPVTIDLGDVAAPASSPAAAGATAPGGAAPGTDRTGATDAAAGGVTGRTAGSSTAGSGTAGSGTAGSSTAGTAGGTRGGDGDASLD